MCSAFINDFEGEIETLLITCADDTNLVATANILQMILIKTQHVLAMLLTHPPCPEARSRWHTADCAIWGFPHKGKTPSVLL